MEYKFENPNLLQACKDAIHPNNQLPAVTLKCPHCSNLGTFVTGFGGATYLKAGLGEAVAKIACNATMRICPNVDCKGVVLVVTVGQHILGSFPPQLIDVTTNELPPECAATLREAALCHSVGAYRASSMMVRRVLEEVCALNGATGPNLHQRIEALKKLVILPLPLFDAMAELKSLGNDAAHVEAKAYDNIGQEESEVSIQLAGEILKSLYQLKGLVSRLQSRRA
jgi:hypothetical protein